MTAHCLSCSANFVCQPMSVTVRFMGRERLSETDEPSAVSAGPFNRQSRNLHLFRTIQSPLEQENSERIFDARYSFMETLHTNFKSPISIGTSQSEVATDALSRRRFGVRRKPAEWLALVVWPFCRRKLYHAITPRSKFDRAPACSTKHQELNTKNSTPRTQH